MKATEIVEKLKSVLLSSDEAPVQEELSKEVEEIEVNEEVALEDMPEEEVPVEEPPEAEAPKYVTKEELESALAELTAMYDQLMEKMGSEEMETEVPSGFTTGLTLVFPAHFNILYAAARYLLRLMATALDWVVDDS